MRIHIKNMVCPRCIMAVREILTESGLHPVSVELGVAEIEEDELTKEQDTKLNQRLQEMGFERIEDRNKQMVDKIKTLIIQKIHHDRLQQGFNWSKWITDNVYHDYRFLSHLFSGLEGITIEQFIIKQKIEKVKELIAYRQMNFSEIAYALGYSSPAHMTNQFRKITGMTPGEFKKLRNPGRKTIDKINEE
ncbi:MAG: AraC family transcriptional regulator [Marinilabilia sp.]